MSAASDFSHPSVVLPLQLPNKYAQVPITQLPAGQVGVAFAYEQTVVQVPQWLTSVLMFCSQPLEASASQLPKPGLQASLHAPAEHVDAGALVKPQTLPHVLQLLVVLSATSQPSAVLPLQLP